MVKGGYAETVPNENYHPLYYDLKEYSTWRSAPSIVFRSATYKHRVTLVKRADGTPRPCWTIVITGSKAREWGFWCPKGFIPWQKFVDQTDEGNIGKGCDQ